MLWDCMLRRWLDSRKRRTEEEDEETDEKVDCRELCEQQVANAARYAAMRAYLSYPS